MYVRPRVVCDEDGQDESDDRYTECGPIDIQTALERYQRLVIVGDPGSGKSTFLKFFALVIARSVLEADTTLAVDTLSLEPPLPIPIFVSFWELSNFIRKKPSATVDVFHDFIAQRFATGGSNLSAQDVAQRLKIGSCCLLFDGLDEVPTEQGRDLVSRLVEQFVAQYPNNRYVITSHTRAYTGDSILRSEFTRGDIQEFNEEDRDRFLRNWFALLFKMNRDRVTASSPENFKAFHDLQKAIEQNDRIRVLVVNPLLLTVVAIVYWNRKRLPEQRVELYDECVDVLPGQRKEAERTERSKNTAVLDADEAAAFVGANVMFPVGANVTERPSPLPSAWPKAGGKMMARV
jgi:predicted NACHT family NTPase